MKIEYILWIVICLIYVVSVIVKARRAASNADEQGVVKKQPGWVEKLNKFVSQLQQMDRQEYVFEDPEPMEEEYSYETIEPAMAEPPLPKKRTARLEASAESAGPAIPTEDILPKELVYGIQDLRKAVIWSEILAPPMALRDE